MLSREENELLVRVGPESAMGKLMRLYWIPFLPGSDLAPDGQPQRVRLLGEDLLAFRDTEGRIGLVDHACPHRGAPLVFARNESSGLRCVYHGWKFDVDGRVVETPAEPNTSRMKNAIRIKNYPCVERNGFVWTYMGPDREAPPPLPNAEWNLLPPENVHISLRVQECNWLQAVEGEIDSAHAAILHGRIDSRGAISDWVAKKDLQPVFECVRQDFGMSIASRRVLDEQTWYWRVNQFVLPFYTLVPPQSKFPELSGHAWVPIDDENTLCIMFSYTPAQPLYEKTRVLFNQGHAGRETGHASVNAYSPKPVSEPYAKYWTRFNPQNGFQFDYGAQTSTWFSGLPGLWVQDAACQSGVSPVFDRTKEHLGVSDTGINKTRRMLLETLRDLAADQKKPVRYDDPDLWRVRALSLTLPSTQPWQQEGTKHMLASPGADFGYQP